MSSFTNCYMYKKNKCCFHCIHLQQDEKLCKQVSKSLRVQKFVCKFDPDPELKFNGVTVFNISGQFKNTFIVVYGVKNPNKVVHNTRDIKTLLFGSMLFINYLRENYKATNIRYYSGLSFSSKMGGEREHLHAMITVDDDTCTFNFSKTPKSFIVTAPYSKDTIVAIDNSNIEMLLDNPNEVVRLLLSRKLNYIFSPFRDSYYLFLNFKCDDDECSCIGGCVSTNLLPSLD